MEWVVGGELMQLATFCATPVLRRRVRRPLKEVVRFQGRWDLQWHAGDADGHPLFLCRELLLLVVT